VERGGDHLRVADEHPHSKQGRIDVGIEHRLRKIEEAACRGPGGADEETMPAGCGQF
jgi:hypothetical protein